MAKAKTVRHVVITGAGTGIGRAIALRFAREGAKLTLLARDVKRLEETAAAAKKLGASATFVDACDVRKPKAIDACFDAASAKLGPIHVCVANAGVGGENQPAKPGHKDRFDEVVDTNLRGAYFTLRAAERHLAPGPDARHLIATASVLARFGVPGYTAYCASKAGILGLVRALAVELAPQNVQVNALCPGWVNTAMAQEGIEGIATKLGVSKERFHEMAMSQVPLRRMSEPEDVAGLVAWLCSPDARGVTGQGLDMNGGAWMG
ncbi:MAG: SDR family oxidoreductase [Planctomycetes bacterium]|nr:SDR family oxidoreductase [Planctomycetota bacterium]